MSSKHGYAAALGLLVVCGLGGCSGGGDNPPAGGSGSPGAGTGTRSSTTTSPATPSTAVTPSSTGTTAAVQIPAAARAHTEEGAEAFVRFFMDQVSRAWTIPDSTLISPLSDGGCLSCADLQKTASELVAEKRRYAANPMTIQSVHAVGEVMGRTHVRVLMTQNKVDVVDSVGNVVLTDPFEKLARTVAVEWRGERWVLFDIA